MSSTRDTILRTAAELLAADGYASLTLDRVARRVGVKTASLYHHVESRDALVEEVMTIGVVRVRHAIEGALADVPPEQPLRRLETAIRGHFRGVVEHSPFTVANLRNFNQLPAELREAVAPRQRELAELWRALFDGVAAAGALPPRVDADALRHLVLGAMNWSVEWRRDGAPADADHLADQLIGLIRSSSAMVAVTDDPARIVRVDADGPVARVRIANPPVNTLTTDVIRSLDAAIESLVRSEARVVLLEGQPGHAFSAGADLNQLRGLDQAAYESYLIELRALLDRLSCTPFPTIAVIEGPALGCGLELAIACTFRVATEDASFGVPQTRMGLSPGAGSAQRLPRLVGQQRALDLVLSGRTITGREAHLTGLVDRLDDRAPEAAERWAAELAGAPRAALAAALRSVRAAEGGALAELAEAVALFDTEAAHEGIEAFAARPATSR